MLGNLFPSVCATSVSQQQLKCCCCFVFSVNFFKSRLSGSRLRFFIVRCSPGDGAEAVPKALSLSVLPVPQTGRHAQGSHSALCHFHICPVSTLCWASSAECVQAPCAEGLTYSAVRQLSPGFPPCPPARPALQPQPQPRGPQQRRPRLLLLVSFTLGPALGFDASPAVAAFG